MAGGVLRGDGAGGGGGARRARAALKQLAVYLWLTAEFVDSLEFLKKSGFAYTTPGATAGDLAVSLGFFGALLATMAACRASALAGLRPGPCGKCCCGGRCGAGGGVVVGGGAQQVVVIHNGALGVQQNPGWAGGR